MTQDDFREQESGEEVVDAALQEHDEVIEQEEIVDGPELEEVDHDLADDDDDLPQLSDKEKTAFERRMEREKVKLQEKLEAELKQQYESQYGRHKQVVELLGGDPDAIEKRIRDNQIAQEAQRLAEANGWDDEQMNWWYNQQKQDREVKELRVQMQISRLRDNPDYAGIAGMEKEILKKIEQTGGALSAEEAYWALGGKNRAEQIRLEAQVRESAKRTQKLRTVLTDSPTSGTGEKPLSPEIAREAERMGISAAEARRLMSKEPAKDLADWRARKTK